MKIVHISTVDLVGGAARAACRLHDGLHRAGEESRMFVLNKCSNDPSVQQFAPSKNPAVRLKRTLRRIHIRRQGQGSANAQSGGYSMFSDDRSIFGAEPWRQCPSADVFQLHWVAGLLDYGAFFRWAPDKTPIVWTLHDMNPFTGGCHYDAECGRFANDCGSCPALSSADEGDLSRQIWKRKIKALARFANDRVRVVAPSRWLAQKALSSSLLGRFSCTVIPYGLDTEKFRPREERAIRDELGISSDARVILFLADGVGDPRKGYSYLLTALECVKDLRDVVVLTLGRGTPEAISNLRHIHIDAVADDERIAEIYGAADVFVAPSLQDNLPNTILESMACGTPVIAFRVGGIPDVVRDGQTGLLAPPRGARALGQAIRELLQNSALRSEMAQNCRRVVQEEYRLDVQANRYVSLYGELLQGVGLASQFARIREAPAIDRKSEQRPTVSSIH
jgi:glycosyltransferase involved in cell wall biosynthesis